MRAVAGAMVRGIGTKVFYVTTGGFDTHSGQGVNQTNGSYYNLMGTLNDGLLAFYNDIRRQGLLGDTLVIVTGEFGRTPIINRDAGRDHWGPVMSLLLAGGGVQGGRVIGATDRHAAQPTADRQTTENLAASESRIRDTDMALEMVTFTRHQIMLQAGTAMLAQANAAPQTVLRLLQG